MIDLRRREAAGGGRDLARLRESYLRHLDVYVDSLASVAVTVADKIDIEREFQKSVEDDWVDLKRDLKIERSKLFTKDILVTAAAAAGALITKIPGITDIPLAMPGLAAVIPVGTAVYRDNALKTNILQKHAMSWLYLLGR